MAEITKAASASLATITPGHEHQTKGLAGEDIGAGDACYVKSDGKVWKSTGAAANAAAKVRGFAAMAAKTGEPVTIFRNVDFHYSSTALTPGAQLFLSGTVAGGLADAASTGGTGAVAWVNPDGKTIHVMESRY